MELNLLGIREGRTYPSEEFFETLSKVGNKVVIGFDAHSPSDFLDKYALPKALKIVEKYNLNLITEPFIKTNE
jgi:histidinol-phosphatase (PHP family)